MFASRRTSLKPPPPAPPSALCRLAALQAELDDVEHRRSLRSSAVNSRRASMLSNASHASISRLSHQSDAPAARPHHARKSVGQGRRLPDECSRPLSPSLSPPLCPSPPSYPSLQPSSAPSSPRLSPNLPPPASHRRHSRLSRPLSPSDESDSSESLSSNRDSPVRPTRSKGRGVDNTDQSRPAKRSSNRPRGRPKRGSKKGAPNKPSSPQKSNHRGRPKRRRESGTRHSNRPTSGVDKRASFANRDSRHRGRTSGGRDVGSRYGGETKRSMREKDTSDSEPSQTDSCRGEARTKRSDRRGTQAIESDLGRDEKTGKRGSRSRTSSDSGSADSGFRSKRERKRMSRGGERHRRVSNAEIRKEGQGSTRARPGAQRGALKSEAEISAAPEINIEAEVEKLAQSFQVSQSHFHLVRELAALRAADELEAGQRQRLRDNAVVKEDCTRHSGSTGTDRNITRQNIHQNTHTDSADRQNQRRTDTDTDTNTDTTDTNIETDRKPNKTKRREQDSARTLGEKGRGRGRAQGNRSKRIGKSETQRETTTNSRSGKRDHRPRRRHSRAVDSATDDDSGEREYGDGDTAPTHSEGSTDDSEGRHNQRRGNHGKVATQAANTLSRAIGHSKNSPVVATTLSAVQREAQRRRIETKKLMLAGSPFIKHTRKELGLPARTGAVYRENNPFGTNTDPAGFLFLTQPGRALDQSADCMRLSEVTTVLLGKQTQAFRRHVSKKVAEELCFSVLSQTATWNLEAASAKLRDDWVIGLMAILRDKGLPVTLKRSPMFVMEPMPAQDRGVAVKVELIVKCRDLPKLGNLLAKRRPLVRAFEKDSRTAKYHYLGQTESAKSGHVFDDYLAAKHSPVFDHIFLVDWFPGLGQLLCFSVSYHTNPTKLKYKYRMGFAEVSLDRVVAQPGVDISHQLINPQKKSFNRTLSWTHSLMVVRCIRKPEQAQVRAFMEAKAKEEGIPRTSEPATNGTDLDDDASSSHSPPGRGRGRGRRRSPSSGHRRASGSDSESSDDDEERPDSHGRRGRGGPRRGRRDGRDRGGDEREMINTSESGSESDSGGSRQTDKHRSGGNTHPSSQEGRRHQRSDVREVKMHQPVQHHKEGIGHQTLRHKTGLSSRGSDKKKANGKRQLRKTIREVRDRRVRSEEHVQKHVDANDGAAVRVRKKLAEGNGDDSEEERQQGKGKSARQPHHHRHRKGDFNERSQSATFAELHAMHASLLLPEERGERHNGSYKRSSSRMAERLNRSEARRVEPSDRQALVVDDPDNRRDNDSAERSDDDSDRMADDNHKKSVRVRGRQRRRESNSDVEARRRRVRNTPRGRRKTTPATKQLHPATFNSVLLNSSWAVDSQSDVDTPRHRTRARRKNRPRSQSARTHK